MIGSRRTSRLDLLLRPGAPVGVVDGGVLEQGGEDEDEAHHQVDVNGLDVANSRKGAANSRADGGHGEDGGDAEGDAGGGRLVVNPKAHPAEHDDEDGGQVGLEDEVADVPLEAEEEGQALVGARGEGLLPVGGFVADDGELGQFDVLDAVHRGVRPVHHNVGDGVAV